MDLVSIGEFGRMARLSPKALRRYDDLGPLVPELAAEALVAGSSGDPTRAELAAEALAAWAIQRGRQPAGAIRLLLIPNRAGDGTGPDRELALPLR
ncbi:hypothetical protein ACFFWC_19830 [Plantactinospora siamensis]|uniref:MerR family transcriptional regulator n=1 Tax=Plantactinospora siamensis TaxID=555372 RepID=A0ABV6P2L9_9ACTN